MRILFIHHSTGGLLLRNGKLREILRRERPDIQFWDHGYNLYRPTWISSILGGITFHTGLSDADGRMTGQDFHIIVGNDSPKGYADIFTDPQHQKTFDQILKFDIILFKNCYPTTRIHSEKKLAEHQEYYLRIFNALKCYPNQFIVFTPPPLRAETTKPAWAARARTLANWMVAQAIGNVTVFDFFDLLADNTGTNAHMLKREYCRLLPWDSHPNKQAHQTIAPIFTKIATRAVRLYNESETNEKTAVAAWKNYRHLD